MSEDPTVLIGMYSEDAPEAPWKVRVVLVQPHKEQGTVEHVAETPEQLWAAVMAILDDPMVPELTRNEGEPERQQQAAGGGGAYEVFSDHAQDIVEAAAGPVFGRIASTLLRNKGQDALKIARLLSRNGGKGRPQK